MTPEYPEISVERKDGQEKFTIKNNETDLNLIGFWQWSSSNLLNNSTRGILAEYIVASALGINQGVRTEWDAYDLETKNGLKLEIKTSGYLQTWHQRGLSKISFGIQPTVKWNPETGLFSENTKRQADVYIFCILASKDPNTVDPMNLDQWEFYVLPTSTLNSKIPNQKTIGFNSLLKLQPQKANFRELSIIINKINVL
jgi:hypothetical protein